MAPANTEIRSGNRLLDCLSQLERAKLVARGEMVSLWQGQVLHQQGAPLTYVHFPLDGVCSSVVTMATGQIVEAATIGNDGLLGAQAYLGTDVSLHTTNVQVAGMALRLRVDVFREHAKEHRALDRIVRHYITYAMRSANQAVACNALHSVEERACRWLLATHDRVGDGAFPLTHEVFAEMLGTHRQTVSTIAAMLQRAGLIQYRRGSVRILNRDALEGASCECYAVTTQLFADLVGC